MTISDVLKKVGTKTIGTILTSSMLTFAPIQPLEDIISIAYAQEQNLNNTAIAFCSYGDSKFEFEIYVIKPTGSNRKRVTYNHVQSLDPAWSSDGKKIAFSTTGRLGVLAAPSMNQLNRGDIYVMNYDGTGLRNITNNGQQNVFPTWSPDGTMIAYSSQGAIYIINSGGGEPKKVTQTFGQDLEWSQNGEKFVYVSLVEGNEEIFVMNRDGTEQKNLTNTIEREVTPTFSPDGTKIAYVRRGSIYVMNSDGTNHEMIAKGRNPSWSPDGKMIAFNRDVDIYVMNSDGTDPINITQSKTGGYFPAWSPFLTFDPTSVSPQGKNATTWAKIKSYF